MSMCGTALCGPEGSGYASGGMVLPRYAQCLLIPVVGVGVATAAVPALAMSMASAVVIAPESVEPDAASGDAGDAAPEASTPSPEGSQTDGSSTEPAPSGDAAPDAAATPETETETTTSSGDATPGTEGTPAGAQPGDDSTPADATEATTPGTEARAEGVTPEEGEAAKPEGGEPIEVRPQAGAADATAAKIVGSDVPPREAVVDPRRRTSDERLLFRAGLLSLGVAGAALVPTVVGLQQAADAGRSNNESRQQSMNRLGIGAGIVAGVYAVTGAVLLSVDARRRRQRATALAPTVGRGQVGVVFSARF
ncbi:MAG: hypothetical protein K0V04_29655 [Deltaproteobacteria bacterium]|nr:hypothetical protein [Deltaproteobacteria bacterium]